MTEITDGLAPASEETAAIAEVGSAQVENGLEATASEDGDDGTEQHEEAKKPARGVQKRIDELVRRANEAERRNDELIAILRQGGSPAEAPQSQHEPAQQGKPQVEQYESYEDFVEALADWKADQKLQKFTQSQQAQTRAQTFEQRIAEFSASTPDFHAVAFNKAVPVTDVMKDVVLDSDIGPQIAYYLGTNLSEAQRIASLPPHRQAAEMGKLEAHLSAPKAAPKPKDPPPPPPKTVAGLASGLSEKNPEEMSIAEYRKWRGL